MYLNFKVRSRRCLYQIKISLSLRIYEMSQLRVRHRVQGVLVPEIHYLEQTTQVSSFPAVYVAHGSVPHCTSIGCRIEFQLAELPVVASGASSTQMAVLRFLVLLTVLDPVLSPARYPEYSLVQPLGHSVLAGIIIDLVRPGTSHTAHVAGFIFSGLPPLFA